MQFPRSSDSRLLVAGVAVFVALVAYLAVAFANTHASSGLAAPNKVAPWTPSASKLTPIGHGKRGVFPVRVTPASPGGATGRNYGAIVQTLVPDPAPGRRYVVGLWLRGAAPGRIGVELNEFRPGVARYPVETTVPATARWRHFTFATRVKGTWLGLAMYVYRLDQRRPTWFAVRGLTASVSGH